MKRAVVLLSGGLDSTTLLYYVKSLSFKPYCLIFDYGQRHKREVEVARRMASQARCASLVTKIDLPWKGSSLTDTSMKLPIRKKINPREIPTTYVPARNIIFLSFAASYAEAIHAQDIFIGANALDYSGYPDCRPAFFQAIQQAFKKGMKSGVKGKGIRIQVPFLHKTKAQIIKQGLKLKVPYKQTWSCYQGSRKPCGKCDSCMLRAKGFAAVNFKDPLLV